MEIENLLGNYIYQKAHHLLMLHLAEPETQEFNAYHPTEMMVFISENTTLVANSKH